VLYDSSARESVGAFLLGTVRELYGFRHAIANLVLNGLRNRYRRSVLGWSWSLLEPLLWLVVMAAVFSLVLGIGLKDYTLFLFSGLLPWQFISNSMVRGGRSLVEAETFLKRVYLPKAMFPVASVCAETVNFVLNLTSLLILGLCIGFRLGWTVLLLPAALLLAFALSLGLALALSVITVYVRDTTQLVQVGLQATLYLLPVLYPLERIPPAYQGYFAANPFFPVISLFQQILHARAVPTLPHWLLAAGISALALALGVGLLRRRGADIIYQL
jgi:ABC-type polysaccharide/polyol phosphate export permease